jgi:hypothetical protein
MRHEQPVEQRDETPKRSGRAGQDPAGADTFLERHAVTVVARGVRREPPNPSPDWTLRSSGNSFADTRKKAIAAADRTA